MAVYHLSLKTLARFKERQRNAQDRSPGSSGTRVDETNEADPPTRMESQTPSAMGNAALPSSVAELLSRSGPELDEFLAECGQPVSRVLIALIYRLGAIETQLARLSASRHAPRTTRAGPGRCKDSSPEATAAGTAAMSKSALLDQVFRKNLALREVS